MKLSYTLWMALILFSVTPGIVQGLPLQDGLLFAFEKCRALSVDLKQGTLLESKTSSFDIHCKKKAEKEFLCSFFAAGERRKLKEVTFTGESELGKGDLVDDQKNRIQFLIGKGFASYTSPESLMLCAGIFLFEEDARKEKSLKN